MPAVRHALRDPTRHNFDFQHSRWALHPTPAPYSIRSLKNRRRSSGPLLLRYAWSNGRGLYRRDVEPEPLPDGASSDTGYDADVEDFACPTNTGNACPANTEYPCPTNADNVCPANFDNGQHTDDPANPKYDWKRISRPSAHEDSYADRVGSPAELDLGGYYPPSQLPRLQQTVAPPTQPAVGVQVTLHFKVSTPAGAGDFSVNAANTLGLHVTVQIPLAPAVNTSSAQQAEPANVPIGHPRHIYGVLDTWTADGVRWQAMRRRFAETDDLGTNNDFASWEEEVVPANGLGTVAGIEGDSHPTDPEEPQIKVEGGTPDGVRDDEDNSIPGIAPSTNGESHPSGAEETPIKVEGETPEWMRGDEGDGMPGTVRSTEGDNHLPVSEELDPQITVEEELPDWLNIKLR
ncbi:hypothetical protein EJ06DRAFT_554809 [Trichodelitschia bisporula]|uniref:Uncharacterized protein n=1 Tax=Trichodelitschia bisporula TaxID=703511 RepID=A0A6G1I225_9PEZI|nr:hypothetical protein EJ06DRAFT_554809 [Trichodelitschia bisporula]